jgi:hypothetical protein
LVKRVTEFFKKLALTEDHLPMKCAMLIETLMKAYERIRAGPPAGCPSSGGPEETEASPANDDHEWRRPEPPTRSSASAPFPASVNTEGNVLEPDPTHGLDFDGLTNLDQMGGIEMFFSKSIWPESVLSGLAGGSEGEEATSFDLRNFFGLYNTQPQF